jgi:hypothetical protein
VGRFRASHPLIGLYPQLLGVVIPVDPITIIFSAPLSTTTGQSLYITSHGATHSTHLLEGLRAAEWKPRMSSAYYNTSSSRDNFVAPPSLLSRLLPPEIMRLWDQHAYSSISTSPTSHGQRKGRWNWRRLLSLPHLLCLVWVLVLFWGERWVFWDAVRECEWGRWERWVSEIYSWDWNVELTFE